jgi:hypothetical protein
MIRRQILVEDAAILAVVIVDVDLIVDAQGVDLDGDVRR